MEYPVKTGQRLELAVRRAADGGLGVAAQGGLTVFVEQALPGERVLAQVTEVRRRYARARVLRVLEASPARVAPPCPLYGRCGGCAMQFMDYAAHLAALQEQVRGQLERLGGAGGFDLLPILGMEEPWRYRNKAAFRAGRNADGQAVLGFVGRRSHAVLEAADCPLQRGEACALARAAQSWMREHDIAPYDETRRAGVVRHFLTRVNRRGEALAVVVTAGGELPQAEALIAALRRAMPALRGVVQNVNSRSTQEILGRECRTLYGAGELEEELCGLRFRLSPLAFFQVNPAQTERLYAQARAFCGLRGKELVVDAYCGAGTISLMLAGQAGRVLGVEIVPEAVHNARENAARNGVDNAEFLEGACEEVLPRLVAQGLRPDVVVLDPPRRGCEEAVLRAAAQCGASRLVYVSCNPATLARDTARLGRLGYVLEAARPVDMFPWTGEVETAARFGPASLAR